MKDKYGVDLEVGDVVIVNNNTANIFERGIIEEISENVVMGLVIAETAFVNYGDIGVFPSSEIIYIEWCYMKLSEKDLPKLEETSIINIVVKLVGELNALLSFV